MKCNRCVLSSTLIAFGLLIPNLSFLSQRADSQSSQNINEEKQKPVDRARPNDPVLWHDPGEIAELNLLYGRGGEVGQPRSPFKFETEDSSGTNPKFEVIDAQGMKWRVKLGDEARPEVTASRLLWAVGYFVDEDYLVRSAKVENLKLTRGAAMASDGHIVDARFEKKPGGEKKV